MISLLVGICQVLIRPSLTPRNLLSYSRCSGLVPAIIDMVYGVLRTEYQVVLMLGTLGS